MKALLPIILLALVVSVSGCVNAPFLQGIFGPTQPAVEQTPDLLIFAEKGVSPSPPIGTDSDFTVWTNLKSQAEPGSEPIKNAIVTVYDSGVCTIKKEQWQPSDWTCKDDSLPCNHIFTDFSPKQVERLEFVMKAPSSGNIGGLETDCRVAYYVSYNSTAVSTDDFDIISSERLKEIQRTGEKPSWTDQPQYVGIGPIKIYFEWKTPGPVEENKNMIFSVRVVDKGKGTFERVENQSFILKLPKDWNTTYEKTLEEIYKAKEFSKTVCGGKFQVFADDANYVFLNNTSPLNLISKETPEIVCTFVAPEIGVPEKTYQIEARLNYTYKLYDEQVVHIVPR
jgi:hypothetical protein